MTEDVVDRTLLLTFEDRLQLQCTCGVNGTDRGVVEGDAERRDRVAAELTCSGEVVDVGDHAIGVAGVDRFRFYNISICSLW